MCIDASAIRKKARQDYHRAVRETEKARREIQRFEQEDRPAYTRWVNGRFGALLTEVRELNQRLAAQGEFLYQVESEVYASDCSFGQAYERVIARREQAARGGPSAQDSQEKQHSRTGSGPNGFDPKFEELFEELRSKFGNRFKADSSTDFPPATPKPAKSAGLKELYRALARLLHPDVQGKMTPEKKEWWHQAQAAYEAGDVERLQVILTLCEIEDRGTTERTSVSLLARITRTLRASLRSLRAQLKQFRRDPAWDFSRVEDRTHLAWQTERELKATLFDMKRRLEAIEQQIAAYARQAETARLHKPVGPRLRRRPDFRF